MLRAQLLAPGKADRADTPALEKFVWQVPDRTLAAPTGTRAGNVKRHLLRR